MLTPFHTSTPFSHSNHPETDRAEMVQADEIKKKKREDIVEALERHRLQQAGLESVISRQPPQLEVQKDKQKMLLLREQVELRQMFTVLNCTLTRYHLKSLDPEE